MRVRALPRTFSGPILEMEGLVTSSACARQKPGKRVIPNLVSLARNKRMLYTGFSEFHAYTLC
jgi:hypothetical protein